MSDDELKEALAKVVWDRMSDQPWREDADETADALLPIVRAYAAAELREAAAEPDMDHVFGGPSVSVGDLRARADALSPDPNRKA